MLLPAAKVDSWQVQAAMEPGPSGGHRAGAAPSGSPPLHEVTEASSGGAKGNARGQDLEATCGATCGAKVKLQGGIWDRRNSSFCEIPYSWDLYEVTALRNIKSFTLNLKSFQTKIIHHTYSHLGWLLDTPRVSSLNNDLVQGVFLLSIVSLLDYAQVSDCPIWPSKKWLYLMWFWHLRSAGRLYHFVAVFHWLHVQSNASAVGPQGPPSAVCGSTINITSEELLLALGHENKHFPRWIMYSLLKDLVGFLNTLCFNWHQSSSR